MLGISFAINNPPPTDATTAEILKFGQENYSHILLGAWLQAVGPVLLVLFAFTLVDLAGAAVRLAGYMTLFGASALMTVNLVEIGFYISALNVEPAVMPFISLRVIFAVQHLYFVVAAPALFLPVGIVLLNSAILHRFFAYSALLLAIIFAAMGIIFMLTLALPRWVTAFGGVQSLWRSDPGVAIPTSLRR